MRTITADSTEWKHFTDDRGSTIIFEPIKDDIQEEPINKRVQFYVDDKEDDVVNSAGISDSQMSRVPKDTSSANSTNATSNSINTKEQDFNVKIANDSSDSDAQYESEERVSRVQNQKEILHENNETAIIYVLFWEVVLVSLLVQLFLGCFSSSWCSPSSW